MYERRVYSFLDLLGDVGGFLEALYVISGFFVASIASRMFMAAKIRDLYHVRVDTNGTDLRRLLFKLPSRSKSFKESEDFGGENGGGPDSGGAGGAIQMA